MPDEQGSPGEVVLVEFRKTQKMIDEEEHLKKFFKIKGHKAGCGGVGCAGC